MPKKPVLYIITNNHFDPTWRRCWNRRFTDRGRSFVSYAELEDYYLTDNLAIARKNPEYKFEAESTVVARMFLQRHPARLAELRRLAKARRFAVTGAGDNIVDANMILGESLVRNFVTGLLWVEDTLGVPVKLGVRNDGFGNSAQLPQIFRGCEIPWVTGFSYSPCPKNYWRGLDGSSICTATVPPIGWAAEARKYPPCEHCQGKGCRKCADRGINSDAGRAVFPENLNLKLLRQRGCGAVMMQYEENLPNPNVIQKARELRRTFDVRFAIEEDFAAQPWLQKMIARVDTPPRGDVHAVELNPNNSGTWVTRIKLKQECRRQEYALLSAESLAALARLKGSKYPRKELAAAWQTLLFTMFHDAITATHVDAAYDELREMWNEIDGQTGLAGNKATKALVAPKKNTISVINTTGGRATRVVSIMLKSSARAASVKDEAGNTVPQYHAVPYAPKKMLEVSFLAKDVPAFGARTFTVVPSKGRLEEGMQPARPVIENQRFRVTADAHGVTAIYDKKHRRNILEGGTYRPGELVLERDTGSPWATLEPDCSRQGMAAWTQFRNAGVLDGRWTMSFEFNLPYMPHAPWARGWLVKGWTWVSLHEGIDRVEFWTRVHWDTHNARLRAAFPIPARGEHVYGIPYGMLERKPYKPTYDWTGANGDWPAINWAGLQSKDSSVALLNKGLPSYRLENAPAGGTNMFLSLLRSPAVPTYLHEPNFYSMTAYDGMRDAGNHVFEYAITAYDAPFAESSVVNDSESYNTELIAVEGLAEIPQAPQCESDHVRISALKCAEHNDDLIVRLWEYRGKGGEVSVRLPERAARVSKVNLLERQPEPLEIHAGRVRFAMRPWEIATLRIEIS
ncbi:MAG TPA: glycosyl hydrolase-related protein [Planctomycetota bacterium]|jgi:alpha-mannosidase